MLSRDRLGSREDAGVVSMPVATESSAVAGGKDVISIVTAVGDVAAKGGAVSVLSKLEA